MGAKWRRRSSDQPLHTLDLYTVTSLAHGKEYVENCIIVLFVYAFKFFAPFHYEDGSVFGKSWFNIRNAAGLDFKN